jgi:hypothetical protein
MSRAHILHLDQPARYRFVLQGLIRADWSDWLSDITVNFLEEETAMTYITGTVRDQSALFGFLSQVRDLGAPLVSVENIAEGKK